MVTWERGKNKLRIQYNQYKLLYLKETSIYRIARGIMGFPDSSAGNKSACNAGDPGLIPQLGRSPEEGNGSPLQYSSLKNSMDCVVHGVTKSQTQLSNFHSFTHSQGELYQISNNKL